MSALAATALGSGSPGRDSHASNWGANSFNPSRAANSAAPAARSAMARGDTGGSTGAPSTPPIANQA